MKCREVYELMQAYIDRELAPEQEKKLEVHLRLCPLCKRRLFSLQRTVTRVRSIGEVVVSEDFVERLLERLPEDVVPPAEREAVLRERRRFQRTVISPRVITNDAGAKVEINGATVRVPRGTSVDGDLTVIGGLVFVGGRINGNLRVLRGQLVRLPGAQVVGKVTLINTPFGLWLEHALQVVRAALAILRRV
jgi:hypothetical protein